MKTLASHRFVDALLAALAICIAIFVVGCGVPLAPGYKIQKQSLAVRFVPGDPPHLVIHAEYRLTNIGNSPLNFIAVGLPDEKGFGRSNLRAEVDGKGIVLQHEPTEPAGDWRISFPASWHQKEKINLSLSYDLAAQPVSDPRIFVTANTFYLNDSGWFPTLMGFKAFLSPAVGRPDPTTLSVTIPANFRVTASGQPRGAKKQNGEIQYRYRIRKGDFDPYVLAGQYQQQIVSSTGFAVVFWTPQPMSAEQAQPKGAQIGSAAAFYARMFGALPKSMKSIIVVDAQTAPESSDVPLPGVIFSWISPQNDGFDIHLVPQSARLDLAATWFDHQIIPRREAWLLANALSGYAFSLSSQNQNEEERSRAIQSLLQDYDRHTPTAVEKPFTTLLPSDPLPQVQIGDAKAELFLFALEDKCGQQNVTHAIAHMVYALRGQQYGYSDFRAALEQECHQNLSDFFDVWLRHKGIPADFRARYESARGNNAEP